MFKYSKRIQESREKAYNLVMLLMGCNEKYFSEWYITDKPDIFPDGVHYSIDEFKFICDVIESLSDEGNMLIEIEDHELKYLETIMYDDKYYSYIMLHKLQN